MEDKTQTIEASLDLSEITIKHGVHSFRYGTSTFLNEIFDFLQLKSSDILYDLGSGYGIILHYAAKRFPSTKMVGIEILAERYQYGEEIKENEKLDNITFYNGDMFEYDFSEGTVFYIFNPLYSSMYDRLIEKLKLIALKKQIIIIAESKCDCFDNTSWLTQYHSIEEDVIRKVHFYRSNF